MALIKGNAQQDKIQRYWYQNDQLGTPIRLTDSIGETLYQCEYNAYGQVIDEKYYSDHIDTLPDNPLRFQGQYYDEETGLHYNLNRYYDPLVGRYITQDPIKLIGSINFYQYCPNPINWIDPLGLFNTQDSGFEALARAERSFQLVPDSFISDVTAHNKQTGLLNKKKDQISGAHNQDSFLESIEMLGAKLVGFKYKDKRFPGLIEYQYQLPKKVANGPNVGKMDGFRKTQTKTTYDPSILSDSIVAEMSNKVAKQAENFFLSNPKKREYLIKVDGYWFTITKDRSTGKISNAFLTIPERNTK